MGFVKRRQEPVKKPAAKGSGALMAVLLPGKAVRQVREAVGIQRAGLSSERSLRLNTRWVAAGLTGMLIGTGLAAAPPALAAATGGYPYYAMPCEHAPYASVGKGYWCATYDWGPKHTQVPNDRSEISAYGYAYRNCTDFVAWKVASLGVPAAQYKGLNNAKDWASPTSPHKLTVDTSPAVGAAAVQTTGDFGHVAYISAYNAKTRVITVEEYNKGQDGNYGTRSGTLSGLGFSKVVHFEKYE
jgi:surface antigen